MEDVGDLARVAVPVATGIATAPLAATGLAGALAAVGASGAAGFAGSGFEGLTDREAGLSDESVGEVLEGAVKEGAIDAAIDGAFLGFGPAFRFVNKARHSRQLAKAQQEIGEVAGKIVQGQTKDVPKAIRALGNVDTSGVKTYQELDEVLTSKIAAIAKEQDELLDTFTDKNAISQFTESFGKGKNKVTTNVVEDAFDHLEELYDKTANPEALSRIRALLGKNDCKNPLAPRNVNLSIVRPAILPAFSIRPRFVTFCCRELAFSTIFEVRDCVLNKSDICLSNSLET